MTQSLIRYSLLCAVVSALLSGIATVCLTVATRQMSVLLVTSMSSILGGLVLLLLLRVLKGSLRLDLLWLQRRLVLRIALLRAVLGALLFVWGVSYTEASKALLFTKMEPYFVLFWGWLLRNERVQRQELLLLVVHIFGAIILSTGGKISALGTAQVGDLLILGSLCVSGYSYPDAKRLGASVGGALSSASTSLLGGVVILVLALLLNPAEPWQSPAQAWLYLSLHALFFFVLSLPLWYIALQQVQGWMVSALRAVGPLAGLPAAYLLLGEVLTAVQVIGALLVLATSAAIGRKHRTRGPLAARVVAG
jgi:drug/metabolite transporter (DMT)-like permease